MPRYTDKHNRCIKCKIAKEFCFCDLLFKVDINIKVIAIMHASELKLSSNTVNLLDLTLKNFQKKIRGLQDQRLDITNIDKIPNAFYLYPDDDAILIDDDFIKKYQNTNITLIVPDGNWHQAKKIKRREPLLKNIPSIKLPFTGELSKYKLRKEPRPEYMSTYEAVAKTLFLLTQDLKLKYEMDYNFNLMVERFIFCREGGKLPRQVTSK